MASAEKKYYVRVSAGPSYDIKTHKLVAVNKDTPIEVSSEQLDAKIDVRIKNYHGLPTGSPETSPYFEHQLHKSDLYSISFSFKLKEDINGNDILWGNDFEHPIRDHLPYGFSACLRIVRWTIDPSIEGDVYADKPYLYGTLLSSINVLRVGDKDDSKGIKGPEPGTVFEEGGTSSGISIREEHNVPEASAQRMKHFLYPDPRKSFTFEAGREYDCDFFNPYLDFNEFSLHLPGYNMHLMKFWDGQPLRYVMKKRDSEDALLVVQIMLIEENELKAEEAKWKSEGAGQTSSAPESQEPGNEDLD